MYIRNREIDGIRGWAAVAVLSFHLLGEMFRPNFPELRIGVLKPFLGGDLAVYVFFILSGDALSISFFRNYDGKIVSKIAIKRYFRLTVPILLSCFVVYILMKLNLVYSHDAAIILNNEPWLGSFVNFDPDIFRLIRFSLIDVYQSNLNTRTFNPFLWTMPIEMYGSVLVFLLLYSWRYLKNPLVVLWIVALFTFFLGSPLSLFFFGVIFGNMRKNDFFSKLSFSKTWQATSHVTVLVIAIFVSLVSYSSYIVHIPMLVSLIATFCFYSNTKWKKFFNLKLSVFLGDVSFPLYLMHFPVIISVMSWLVIYSKDNIKAGNLMTVLSIFVIGFVLSFILAFILRMIEKRVMISIDKWCENIVMR